MMDIIAEMRTRLKALEPDDLEIEDDSLRHQGHEGAKSGGGHYNLLIVSRQFENQSQVARHRMVFEALDELMHKQIHALSIKAYTPKEI